MATSGNYQYPKLKVESPNVKYTVDDQGETHIESLYEYEHVKVEQVPTEAHTIKVSTRPDSII